MKFEKQLSIRQALSTSSNGPTTVHDERRYKDLHMCPLRLEPSKKHSLSLLYITLYLKEATILEWYCRVDNECQLNMQQNCNSKLLVDLSGLFFF